MRRLIGAAALVCVASCGGGSPSAPSAPGNPGVPGVPGTPGTAGIALTGNLAFGEVLVGASATSTLTISNPGTAALTVSGVTGPNGFTPSWTSGTIAAGASQAVTIGFAPTTAGDYGGTVTVNANQSSGTNTMGISGAAYPGMSGAWAGTHVSSGAGQSVTCNLQLDDDGADRFPILGNVGAQRLGMRAVGHVRRPRLNVQRDHRRVLQRRRRSELVRTRLGRRAL